MMASIAIAVRPSRNPSTPITAAIAIAAAPTRIAIHAAHSARIGIARRRLERRLGPELVSADLTWEALVAALERRLGLELASADLTWRAVPGALERRRFLDGRFKTRFQ